MTLTFSLDEFEFAQFDAMAELFSKEFESDDRLLSGAYTRWLYEDNPCGRAKIVTATDGRNWVGFMAMIPVALMRRSAVRVAYYVVNVLVDPTQRGKNIFGQMIEVAHNYVRREGAILMGHPNAAAEGAWRRAKMRFQSPLTARIVPPCRGFVRVRTEPLKRGETGGLVDLYNADIRVCGDMSVVLTEDYVEWRFFRHPTNAYQLRSIVVDGEPAGFSVVRKLRTGLHLLIDLFAIRRHAAAAMSCCPLFTLAFTTGYFQAAGCTLWRSPVRKELPFFCTDNQTDIAPPEAARLGLATSDF